MVGLLGLWLISNKSPLANKLGNAGFKDDFDNLTTKKTLTQIMQ